MTDLTEGLRELADHLELYEDAPTPHALASYFVYGPGSVQGAIRIIQSYPDSTWTLTPEKDSSWVKMRTAMGDVVIQIGADRQYLCTVAPDYLLRDLHPAIARLVTVVEES